MKNILHPLMLACCLLFITGCEEQNQEQKFDNIKLVIENGTTFSVKTYIGTINNDTTAEKVSQYFLDSANFVKEAITTGKIEPLLFKEYVSNSVRDNVPTPYNIAIINALELSLSAYNSFYAENVKEKIENLDKAKQVLNSIVDGILSGIDPVSGDILTEKNPLEGYTDFKL